MTLHSQVSQVNTSNSPDMTGWNQGVTGTDLQIMQDNYVVGPFSQLNGLDLFFSKHQTEQHTDQCQFPRHSAGYLYWRIGTFVPGGRCTYLYSHSLHRGRLGSSTSSGKPAALPLS